MQKKRKRIKKKSPCSHLCEQGDCFTLCLCFDPYDFLKYRYNIKELTKEEAKKELNVLEGEKKEIEESLKKREYVWELLEQRIADLRKQL
ncbi:hypothetical protein [Gallibacter sp. Marseille-QA0791]|uniref:hypothetical protein n=1 Tax=Gallibacter sp. Marseille-QA0791 TaxID=3378781 RepID=UPI003D12FBA1